MARGWLLVPKGPNVRMCLVAHCLFGIVNHLQIESYSNPKLGELRAFPHESLSPNLETALWISRRFPAFIRHNEE